MTAQTRHEDLAGVSPESGSTGCVNALRPLLRIPRHLHRQFALRSFIRILLQSVYRPATPSFAQASPSCRRSVPRQARKRSRLLIGSEWSYCGAAGAPRVQGAGDAALAPTPAPPASCAPRGPPALLRGLLRVFWLQITSQWAGATLSEPPASALGGATLEATFPSLLSARRALATAHRSRSLRGQDGLRRLPARGGALAPPLASPHARLWPPGPARLPPRRRVRVAQGDCRPSPCKAEALGCRRD